MAAGHTPASSQLTKMLTARVPAGFGDQVREAARAEGVRPGALIRSAISERIERTGGAQPMTEAERETVVSFGGEGLAKTIERAAADPRFNDSLNHEIDASRFQFMVCITAAYEHLGAYIEIESARSPDEAQGTSDVVEAVDRLISAYDEFDAAFKIRLHLVRLAVSGEANNGIA